uniref:Uncharacterized protein n=1 Tax=uncultured Thiotrichaceae bacterium TaxID=298394 RepID=A0A6S6UEG3_9GAMM|nr:MAG: Unknown protein [uncultured Thiotrichaceae bacterium]
MRGAGGTSGGGWEFLIGLIMMCSGFYMLLSSIVIRARFGFSYQVYSVGGFGITSGMIMIPFLFGVAMVFYNSRSYLGWLLTIGSLISLIFGVISNVHFSMQRMSAFDMIVILVLAFGGIGLFLKSLRAT